MTQFIDLSVTLEARVGVQYAHGEPEITYINHEESAEKRGSVYGLKPSDFREGKYAAVERVCVGTLTLPLC